MRDPPAAALPGAFLQQQKTLSLQVPGGRSAAGTTPSPQTLPPRRSKPSSSVGPVGDGGTQRETQHPQGYPELQSRLSSAIPPQNPKQGPRMGKVGFMGPGKQGLHPKASEADPRAPGPTSISCQRATVGN